MHLEDSFEVVGVGFCGVIGRVDYVDVAWYEMSCAVRRSARRKGIAYYRGITGGMVVVRDGGCGSNSMEGVQTCTCPQDLHRPTPLS